MIEEFLKNTNVLVKPLANAGSYIAEVRGLSPSNEILDFDIELLACHSPQVLEDTLTSKMEEILSCKYGYEYDDYDEEDLIHDGGIFK